MKINRAWWHICPVRRLFRTSLHWRYNERDSVSNHRRLDCLINRLFKRRSKVTSKLRVTGLCEGNSPMIGEFPEQRVSDAENVSIWWRHHDQQAACQFVVFCSWLHNNIFCIAWNAEKKSPKCSTVLPTSVNLQWTGERISRLHKPIHIPHSDDVGFVSPCLWLGDFPLLMSRIWWQTHGITYGYNVSAISVTSPNLSYVTGVISHDSRIFHMMKNSKILKLRSWAWYSW